MPTLNVYTITNKAGAYIAGRKRPSGNQISLTSEQAAYEVSIGALIPTGATAPSAPDPLEIRNSDSMRISRASDTTSFAVSMADVKTYVGGIDIDAQTAVSTLNSTDLILVSQGGVEKKAQVSDLSTLYVQSSRIGVASGVASLDNGGKIPTTQLPALAINDTFTVASQAAMLALTAEQGDIAVRTDNSKTYILASSPAATLANWRELKAGVDATVADNITSGTLSDARLSSQVVLKNTNNDMGGNIINNARALITQQTANYTLAPSDCGSVVRLNSSSALNLTLPNNMPVGYQVSCTQAGTGQVTLNAQSGATINSADNQFKTRTQHSAMSLLVVANSGGAAAVWHVSGDTIA